jgi:signal transduction histidine kinase
VYKFLLNNRDELILRCAEKVALRPLRGASHRQLANGVPLFLDQLIRTLKAEESGDDAASLRISGASGGDAKTLSEIGVSATAHGKSLLDLGYSVDQVVHDYGDLCQSITALAVERDAPFSIAEFGTLNRCLDNAIADAVTAFAEQRDAAVAQEMSAGENQRLGFLVHELRNHLLNATLAFSALEVGKLSIGGSTAGLLKRSLTTLGNMLTEAIAEVREGAIKKSRESFSIAALIADAETAGVMQAEVSGCTLNVAPVDPRLAVTGNQVLLNAALANLLQNAFKFTRPQTEIRLSARGAGDRILIEVQDHCGGLPEGAAEKMFKPFAQAGHDKSGLGLGLSIARQSIEADGGRLTVQDLPGEGCIFTIDLPRQAIPQI